MWTTLLSRNCSTPDLKKNQERIFRQGAYFSDPAVPPSKAQPWPRQAHLEGHRDGRPAPGLLFPRGGYQLNGRHQRMLCGPRELLDLPHQRVLLAVIFGLACMSAWTISTACCVLQLTTPTFGDPLSTLHAVVLYLTLPANGPVPATEESCPLFNATATAFEAQGKQRARLQVAAKLCAAWKAIAELWSIAQQGNTGAHQCWFGRPRGQSCQGLGW